MVKAEDSLQKQPRGALFLPNFLAFFVLSCAPGSISESNLTCEETRGILSDRDYIINALSLHFDADERLLREFPEGTEPARYSGYSDREISLEVGKEEAGGPENEAKPPFVPAHFRSFKARAKSEDPDATKEQVVSAYLDKYPKCCRALSPRWLREGGWSENIHYAPASQSGIPGRWVKDVWVIDDDIENADRIWLDESNYTTSHLQRDQALKRFLFTEIFQKGDSASTQCGKAYYVIR
ncbi:hypothetical protein [Erythrobacter sp. MTPC3]|uniref:hypothetical protein n=1 Tax=Erythrobacter sp. MTPC3 TaxID=3056564 RepID=UPI0036F29DA8